MLKPRSIAVAAIAVFTIFMSLSCGGQTTDTVDRVQDALMVRTFTQQAYLKASNTSGGSGLGSVMAISADGQTLAVGAPGEGGSGAVYVYVRSGSTWTQQAYLKASNAQAGDIFGAYVALSANGDTLAVGAPWEDSIATGINGVQNDNTRTDSGAAYVFRRNSGAWTQQAYVKATNTDGGDEFGRVALSGDGNTLAIGAAYESSSADGVGGNQADNLAIGSGAVYVYVWSGTVWAAQSYIKATNSETGDAFGGSLALSTDGNTLAVSASYESSSATGINGNQSDNSAGFSGAVYVYGRSGSTWSAQAYIKAPNTGSQDEFGHSVSLSNDGNTLAVGAAYEDSNAILVNGDSNNDSAAGAGAGYVYTRASGNWSLHSYVKSPNTESGDYFGYVVALSGDGITLAISARGEDGGGTGVGSMLNDNSANYSGAVYTYSLGSGGWALSNYVKASNTQASDGFASITLSSNGETMAVGASNESSSATGINGNQSDNSAAGSGAVYVFTSSLVPTFEQQAYVKASNTDTGDALRALALSDDGNTLVVGASGESSAATGIGGNQLDDSAYASGAVYVLSRSAGVWTQQAYLKASNTNAADSFGSAVALSGDGNTLAVGAPVEFSNATGVNGNQSDNSLEEAGAVYVFVRSAGVWTQQAYVKASNTDSLDAFGGTLAISGDGNTLVVGATGEASNATGINGSQTNNSAVYSGAAYAFTRSGGTWSQQAYIKASNTEAWDRFGTSISLSSNGDTLAISAPGESSSATLVNGSQANNLASASGAVYVYSRSGGTWSQQAYVKASNTGTSDSLSAVSLSADGNTLAIGAGGEDSNALDVNGTQSNNSAMDSGAAYVYTRSGSNWSHQAYIKASNTGASDRFGDWLTLSDDGNTLAVAAYEEDGGASGVNGNRSDNSASNSGAVFTFTRSGATWSRGDYVKASNTQTSDRFGSASPALSSDGNTLVVSAAWEASAATGVNGNQSDNSAGSSGAAYVYVR